MERDQRISTSYKSGHRAVAVYTVISTVVTLAGLFACFYRIEALQSAAIGKTGTESATVLPIHVLITLMLVSGAIGGCLFNIHSLIKHVGRGDFQEKHALAYYFNPISGAVCGFIVIVLFLGGVLTLGLGELANDMALKHPGRLMPFVGIAVIAGYGSRQFKRKMDELADTLFRTSESASTSSVSRNVVEPPSNDAGDGSTRHEHEARPAKPTAPSGRPTGREKISV